MGGGLYIRSSMVDFIEVEEYMLKIELFIKYFWNEYLWVEKVFERSKNEIFFFLN